jgi:hypothetical protein
MKSKKRELNNELYEIWVMLMREKLDRAMERQKKAEHIEEYRRLDGYINGIGMSLSIFAALIEGKLSRDYERLLKMNKGEEK